MNMPIRGIKAMEITAGIHQIDGVWGANSYLVVTEANMLVIDTGMPGNEKKIIKYVETLGKTPANINYIVLTHADIDHIGSAAGMKKMTGAKLAIHAGDAPILSGKSGFKSVGGPLRVIFKLMTRLMRFQAVGPDVILQDNAEIDGFKVIHTPGHTNGSICLYQPGKAVFVGDALRSDPKGNPKPPAGKLSADRARAKASLMAISQLEFDILLPGHGAPVVGDASTKLKNLLTHLK
jgi:hydroxyacylglutathione hydrolase